MQSADMSKLQNKKDIRKAVIAALGVLLCITIRSKLPKAT